MLGLIVLSVIGMASVLSLLWFPMMVCMHACTAAVVVYVYSSHGDMLHGYVCPDVYLHV